LSTEPLTVDEVNRTLDRLVQNYDQSAFEMTGLRFKRIGFVVSLTYAQTYDSAKPSERNPTLYPDRREVKDRLVELCIEGRRRTHLETRRIGSWWRLNEVKQVTVEEDIFDDIHAILRSTLKFLSEKKGATMTDFNPHTGRIFTDSTTNRQEDEERKVLSEETFPRTNLDQLDGFVQRAISEFHDQLGWKWFKG
jgi:hypothetical protein